MYSTVTSVLQSVQCFKRRILRWQKYCYNYRQDSSSNLVNMHTNCSAWFMNAAVDLLIHPHTTKSFCTPRALGWVSRHLSQVSRLCALRRTLSAIVSMLNHSALLWHPACTILASFPGSTPLLFFCTM